MVLRKKSKTYRHVGHNSRKRYLKKAFGPEEEATQKFLLNFKNSASLQVDGEPLDAVKKNGKHNGNLPFPKLTTGMKSIHALKGDGTLGAFIAKKHLAEILFDYGYPKTITGLSKLLQNCKYLVEIEMLGKKRVGFYGVKSRTFMELDSRCDLRNIRDSFILSGSIVLNNRGIDGCTFEKCMVSTSSIAQTNAKDSDFSNCTLEDCVYEVPVKLISAVRSGDRVLAEKQLPQQGAGIPLEDAQGNGDGNVPALADGNDLLGRIAAWLRRMLNWKKSGKI